jgi:hypothetical protein
MTWRLKGTRGLLLYVLCAFYKQKVLEAPQQVHAIFILRQVFVVGEGFTRLGIFTRGPALSFFDMLLVI